MKSKLMLRIFLCLLTTITLQGCIGLGAVTIGDQTGTLDYPLLSKKRSRIYGKGSAESSLDANLVKEHWGEPDTLLKMDSGQERWDYAFKDFRWHGVIILALIVPIPLAVPFGHDHVSLVVEDNKVKSLSATHNSITSMIFCGYVTYSQPSGWMCGAHAPKSEAWRTFREYRKENLIQNDR